MDHLLISIIGILLVLVVAFVLWRFNPDFARNSSRAMFMRDLANRSESKADNTNPPKRD